MSQATSPSAKKTYGIQRVCRTWKLSRATVQRCKAAAGAPASAPGKRGPHTCQRPNAITTTRDSPLVRQHGRS